MRITETVAQRGDTSSAVTAPIGAQLTLSLEQPLQRGDVDSTNERLTRATTPMRGLRTSTTATRTTTTRTTSFEPEPSADQHTAQRHVFSYSDHQATPPFTDLVQAYFDCRRTKRNSLSARQFECNLEANLHGLYDDLVGGTYRPGRSICFVITRPKPREVWAAEFRDRIVHHLLYNRIAPRFHARFIANSCACIPGRGTLYAVQRLEHDVRSITRNWSRPAFYLKCDLANFFVSIDKTILQGLVARHVTEPWWRSLADLILFHDPRDGAIVQSPPALMARVPTHKKLGNQPAHRGLPIGNLSSQFFANIYLNELDQFAKHRLRARHYVRYVDDFILLHESPQWLNAALAEITAFLPDRLAVQLNPAKTILQPIDRGVDFVGQVIKPWRRTLRPRTLKAAMQRVASVTPEDLHTTANSYFGLLRQTTASHHHRAVLGRLLMRRGHTIEGRLTKTYRRSA